MKTATIALRQVIRSRRRTSVTVGAMAFAGVMMVFYASLVAGLLSSMERHALGTDTGDMQIHAAGFLDDPSLYTMIEDPAPILAGLDQRGYKASPRLVGFGLVAAGTSSSGAVLRGVDVVRQPRTTRLHETLREGQWLDAASPEGVVLGRKLARTLGVSLGDEVIVLGQDAMGAMANELFKVRGILGTVSESVDRGGVFMTEGAFRNLMVVEKGVHEIVVMRADPQADLALATAEVRALAQGQEVKNWRELLPVMATMMDSSDVGMFLMIFITYAAVAMVILNAMLMSVFERIREFGVMKAIGVSPTQVGLIILFEAIIQAAAASILAVAIGVPLSLYFERHGIQLGSFIDGVTVGGVSMIPVWHCSVTVSSVLTPVSFLFVITLAAVLYPALKAALIKPVEALRHR